MARAAVWRVGALALAMVPTLVCAQAMLEVKLGDEKDAETIRTVARLGQPEPIQQRAGEGFETVAGRKCGAVHPAYIQAFLDENPSVTAAMLGDLPAGRTYLYPACARAPEAATAEVRRGQSLEGLLDRYGFRIDAAALDGYEPVAGRVPREGVTDFRALIQKDPADLGAVRQARRAYETRFNTRLFADLNPDLIPRLMQPGDSIKIPHREPSWAMITLRPNISASYAKTQLQASIDLDGGSSQVSDVATADLVSEAPPAEVGHCPAPASGWPFDTQALSRALTLNGDLRPKGKYPKPATVLVLDTGYDSKAAATVIPADRMAPLKDPRPLSGRESLEGVNLATGELSAMPPEGLGRRWHGLEVGAVVLGGRSGLTVAELKHSNVRLAFASVAATDSNGPILSANAVYEVMAYAIRNDIKIVNVSLAASARRDEFLRRLNDEGRYVLLIAAAGNDGHEFGTETPTWPGGHGGDPKNAGLGHVITVGSHDQNGQRSPFSRYGGEIVDFFAPGCQMPTYTPGAAGGPAMVPAERAGTSFSAPLVSFIAAQMLAEGLEVPHIKARFIMGVDVDEDLDGVVYSRGRLNIAKTMNLWSDTVEYREGGASGPVVLRVGTVDRSKVVKPCGVAINVGKLRKLAYSQSKPDKPRKAHIWTSTSDPFDPTGFVKRPLCQDVALAGQALLFTEAGTTVQIPIPLADLVDFVPRTLTAN